MADIPAAIHSHQRVAALAEVCHRYAAVITGLTRAIDVALPHVDEDARPALDGAIRDAESQIAAIDDALSAARRDLPEGAYSPTNSPMGGEDVSDGEGTIEP